MIYLASPYNSNNKKVQKKRAHAAFDAAGYFMSRGIQVFSPIAYGCALLKKGEYASDVRKLGHKEWMDYDLDMLVRCDVMFILAIDGWEESKGVQEEISFARDHLIPIYTVNPDECYCPRKYDGQI